MSDTPSLWRLRSLLTYPFIGLILIPALVVALTSLYTGLAAVDTLSERVITDVSSRVEQAAVHQLDEAAVTLRSTVPDVAQVHGSAETVFNSQALIEKRLFELTGSARTTNYIFYGGADGSFVGVERGREGARNEATLRLKATRGDLRRIYKAKKPGDRSQLLDTEVRNFDVSERPWFSAAQQAKRLTWTPIYVSFASRSLVTTASKPLFSSKGDLLGVLAADVELSELSSFMKTVSVSETGVAFIVDNKGYLVASSSATMPFDVRADGQHRVRVAESTVAVEHVAARWWERLRLKNDITVAATATATEPGAVTAAKIVDGNLGTIDIASRRVRGMDGVDWDIVVAIPRSDLTAPIVRSAAVMFAVIVLALAAALKLGLWIVRRVTDDVDGLVKAANQYSTVNEVFEKPNTSLQETSVLASAFARMFARIGESSATIRQQNEALATLNANLEDRVERRTAQLEEKNFALEREIQRREVLEQQLRDAKELAIEHAESKARFVAMLSHELRTPLQAVIGQSQMLSASGVLDQSQSRLLDSASQSLLTLVDGVLSQNFIETGRVEPKASAFDLHKSLQEAIAVACAANRVDLNDVVLDIVQTLPATVVTDVGVVRQLVSNLVANAFKHAPGCRVFVAVSMEPWRPELLAAQPLLLDKPFYLKVRISDNGPGVPLAQRAHLFEPRVLRPEGAVVGAKTPGLGLLICALMVRSLGGVIRYVDIPSAGATFEFLVIASDAALPSYETFRGADVDAAPQSARQLRCLLVDDYALNLRLVTEMLTVLGHHVTAVESGEAAIAAVSDRMALESTTGTRSTEMFDVIIMDLRLPGISGVEAIREIDVLCERANRARPRYVVLTASSRAEVEQAASRFDDFAYVSKPATLGSLETALRPRVLQTESNMNADASAMLSEDEFPTKTLEQLLDLERKGKKPFLRALLLDYVQSLPNETERLIAAHKEGNSDRVRAISHSMVGAAEQVGAKSLTLAIEHAKTAVATEPEFDRLRAQSIAASRVILGWLAQRYSD